MDTTETSLKLASPVARRAPRSCWVTVPVAGEIDAASAPDVLATLLAASEPETAGIVVDVSDVTFFSAAGITAFIQARNHEREHGRDLLLGAPSPIVRRVLDICDLNDLVEPPATSKPTSVPVGAGPSWSVRTGGRA